MIRLTLTKYVYLIIFNWQNIIFLFLAFMYIYINGLGRAYK